MNPRCVAIFILLSVLALPGQNDDIHRAENLFAGRDQVENLQQAISLLEGLLAREPSNYEAHWRLAKYRFYLSDGREKKAERLQLLKAGSEAAKKAIHLQSDRVEGHYWLAANTGGYADLKGGIKAFWLIRRIRREFQAALKIDPGFENGGAYVALGELDLRLPGLLGGNHQRGIKTLEAGLRVAPRNAELKLTLAEAYAGMGREAEARQLLKLVLRLDDPSRTLVEQEDIRRKARRLLDNLGSDRESVVRQRQ